MLSKLKEKQNPLRYTHTLGVMGEAVRIAEKIGVDKEKAKLGALLHDCAKNLDEAEGKSLIEISKEYDVELDEYAKEEKALIHAFLGAAVAKKDYGITDSDVLDSIYYHTTARPNMTPLEKVIYIADMTEPGRTIEQSDEIRKLVDKDIDEALLYSIGCSIKHVIRKGTLIHPDSIDAFNYLVRQRRINNDSN